MHSRLEYAPLLTEGKSDESFSSLLLY